MRLRSEENEVNDDKSLNAILSCEISNMIVRHSKVFTAVTSVFKDFVDFITTTQMTIA